MQLGEMLFVNPSIFILLRSAVVGPDNLFCVPLAATIGVPVMAIPEYLMLASIFKLKPVVSLKFWCGRRYNQTNLVLSALLRKPACRIVGNLYQCQHDRNFNQYAYYCSHGRP